MALGLPQTCSWVLEKKLASGLPLFLLGLILVTPQQHWVGGTVGNKITVISVSFCTQDPMNQSVHTPTYAHRPDTYVYKFTCEFIHESTHVLKCVCTKNAYIQIYAYVQNTDMHSSRQVYMQVHMYTVMCAYRHTLMQLCMQVLMESNEYPPEVHPTKKLEPGSKDCGL
jgi:hypothetical protein